jgi:DNA-binding transcriptional regulator LsrR (DeoR family)
VSAPRRNPNGQRAAAAYLAGGTTMRAVAAQYGLSQTRVHQLVERMRAELAAQGISLYQPAWPEDEVTC